MNFFERLVVPVLQMVFGVWYISYMLPTWVGVEPFVIGKFTQIVISWERNPVMYVVSIVVSGLGAVACFCIGFTSVFNVRNLWKAIWLR